MLECLTQILPCAESLGDRFDPGQQRPPRGARPVPAVARARPRPLVDLLGAAVAGARLDRDRGRPVPRHVLAWAVAVRCRRSAGPSACSCSSCSRSPPRCRCSWCACRAPMTACAASTATAACRIAPPPRSPTRWRRRRATRFPPRCGARIWSARCWPRARSRPGGRCRGSRCAIPMRCARWCSSSRSRPSLPPAASAGSASPRRSTGRAWWRRRTSGSTPG